MKIPFLPTANEKINLAEKTIKPYFNHRMYTDVDPYEVVKVLSDKKVVVRALDTERITNPEFIAGWFSAHCTNDKDIEYSFSKNPKNREIEIKFSESRGEWYGHGIRGYMSDQPIKYYDYNF